MASTLGETARELRARAGNDALVTEVFTWLWSDIVKPLAKTHERLDAGRHELDNEARAIWSEIQEQPVICRMCTEYVRHEHA